ncbi:hypothetical protein AX14_000173 [Amanita brunnescens Koide BX004]|nr:hypothetical protein AX14_000173 [Amanita brunnescens Koide BX004]
MMVLEELRLGVGLTRLLRTRRKSGQASSKFQSFKFSLAMTYALSRENTYVRVTGGLKSFGNKRYINALHIRPIKDPHEVYYHIAETINSSLVLERGAPPAPGQDNASRSGANRDTSAYTAQSYSNPGGMEQYNQLPPLQRSIIKFIIDNRKDEQGVHVAAILRGLNTDRSKIDGTIEKLLDEGHIFTTLDDSHFNVSS